MARDLLAVALRQLAHQVERAIESGELPDSVYWTKPLRVKGRDFYLFISVQRKGGTPFGGLETPPSARPRARWRQAVLAAGRRQVFAAAGRGQGRAGTAGFTV
jgi:hypothetical protein